MLRFEGVRRQEGVRLEPLPGGLLLGFDSAGRALGDVDVGDEGFVLSALNLEGEPRWVRGESGTSLSLLGVATEGDRVVFAAKFQGELSIGGRSYEAQDLGDFLVAELDANGDYLWSRAFHCSGYALSMGLDVGPDGRIHLAGGCFGSVDFGQGELGAEDEETGFYAVLSDRGVSLSSTTLGSDAWTGDGVRAGSEGTLVYGRLWGAADFGTGTIGADTALEGFSDGLVLFLDPAGQVAWARAYGALANDSIVGVASGENGAWIAGDGAGDFGLGNGVRSLGPRGGTFVVGVDEVGQAQADLVWPNVAGASVASVAGGLGLTGWLLEGDLDFGRGPEGTSGDVVVAVLDDEAGVQCLRRYDVQGAVRSTAIAPGPGNSVFVAGTFQGSLGFGDELVRTGGEEDDVFLIRLSCLP